MGDSLREAIEELKEATQKTLASLIEACGFQAALDQDVGSSDARAGPHQQKHLPSSRNTAPAGVCTDSPHTL